MLWDGSCYITARCWRTPLPYSTQTQIFPEILKPAQYKICCPILSILPAKIYHKSSSSSGHIYGEFSQLQIRKAFITAFTKGKDFLCLKTHSAINWIGDLASLKSILHHSWLENTLIWLRRSVWTLQPPNNITWTFISVGCACVHAYLYVCV